MKNKYFKKFSFIYVISLIIFVSLFTLVPWGRADDDEREEEDDDYWRAPQVIQTIFSQEEDEDREDEDREDEDREDEDEEHLNTISNSGSASAGAPKTETITIVLPNNAALLATLKDSDNDGIPDIIDKHPGEDDFAYFLVDKNNNGLSDDLEILLK